MIKSVLRALRQKIVPKIIYGGIRSKLLIIAGIIITLVFSGAYIASTYLDMTFNQGVWWTWTHMMDPGFIVGDHDHWYKMLLGSFIAFVGVIIVAGAFLTILNEIIESMVEHLQKGRIPKRLEGHTVIAGTGDQLKNFIDAVKVLSGKDKQDQILVVIPEQRYLEQTKSICVGQTLIAIDHIWTEDALDRLHFKSANRVILLENFGGDISTMLKVITQINRLRSQKKNIQEMKVYIELNSRSMLPVLQSSMRRFIDNSSKMEICWINMANASARLALLNHPLDIEKKSKQVTLMFLGWSDFAEALLQQVLRVGHYINSTRIIIATDDNKTMQDKIAHDFSGIFSSTYAQDILTVECIATNTVSTLKTQVDENITVAICGDNNDEIFIKAMELATSGFDGLKQMFVELPDGSGYRDVIDAMNKGEKDIPIVPVRSHAKAFELMEKLDKFAKQGHDKYIKEREKQGQRIKKADGSYDSPADYSWDMLDEIHRGWNRSPADHAEIKLRILADKHQMPRHKRTDDDCLIVSKALKSKAEDIIRHYEEKLSTKNDDLELLAMLEHNRWSGEKFAEGWVYGEETNKALKISSYLVAYKDLANEIQQYDREQVAVQLGNLLVGSV
mgnify:CR=1 FL=1